MANLAIPVQHPRSAVVGAQPTSAQILQGQIAINFADRKIYTQDNTGAIIQLGVAPGNLATVATTGNYNDLTNKPSGTSYVLPAAQPTVLGGVKIPAGSGLSVDGTGNLTAAVISVNGKTGTVSLISSDVGIPTDLLSGPSGTIKSTYLPAALAGALSFKGNWNASTNTPTLANGGVSGGTAQANGSYYVVSVAGSTTIDGISTWTVGDLALVSNSVWTRIANSGSNVTSVNGHTGAVTLTAADLGLATVATTGSYTNLINVPSTFAPSAHTQNANTIIGLATVATSGDYNDLINKPPAANIARLPVNVQGNPNVIQEVFYDFAQACQFPANFAGSVATVKLISGTTSQIRIMQYNTANPNGTQIGTLNIDTVNGNSFTSVGGSVNTYNITDELSYQFVNTNISRFTITLLGTWL